MDNMIYEKVRRKVCLDDGNEKLITLYKCYCKWGTQNGLYALLFDEPKMGVITKDIKDENNIKY